MAEYLVKYYNGRSDRDSVFSTLEEAEQFLRACGDLTATIWRRVRDD